MLGDERLSARLPALQPSTTVGTFHPSLSIHEPKRPPKPIAQLSPRPAWDISDHLNGRHPATRQERKAVRSEWSVGIRSAWNWQWHDFCPGAFHRSAFPESSASS